MCVRALGDGGGGGWVNQVCVYWGWGLATSVSRQMSEASLGSSIKLYAHLNYPAFTVTSHASAMFSDVQDCVYKDAYIYVSCNVVG